MSNVYEITYDGLWRLHEDVMKEIERINLIEPSERHMSERLSYPLLVKEQKRLWNKITSHELYGRTPVLDY